MLTKLRYRYEFAKYRFKTGIKWLLQHLTPSGPRRIALGVDPDDKAEIPSDQLPIFDGHPDMAEIRKNVSTQMDDGSTILINGKQMDSGLRHKMWESEALPNRVGSKKATV
jgi:hypothetical protein